MNGKRRKAKLRPAEETESGVTLASVTPLISAVSLFVAVGAVVFAMERLKERVYARTEFTPHIRVQLDSPPAWVEREGWRPRILACIHLSPDQQWLDEGLVRRVADQINRSGWVSKVDRVTQSSDGILHIACDYRRPIAMLRTDRGYIPVDRDGTRLPTGSTTEVYDQIDDDSGWMKIEGVSGTDSRLIRISEVPEVGEVIRNEDARAAIRIAALIFDQDFSGRISRVDVSNFHGRVSKRENHIKLVTRDGGKIEWGSAIGEEFEEPNALDKIRNIAMYFKRGSPQAQVDMSVYRTGWIEPAAPVIRTADGSRSRDR